MARLVDGIARDTKWLHETLAAAAKGDSFTEQLLSISRELASQDTVQPLQLGILRSDYMLHKPTEVEQDTNAPLGKLLSQQAGGGLAKQVSFDLYFAACARSPN